MHRCLPVAGTTDGIFSNATGGSSASGNIWTYGNGNGASNVVCNTAVFSGTTPAEFLFGSLTVNNTSNGDNGTFTANLGLAISFTTPNGQAVNFSDALELLAVSGSHDTLVLDFGGLPCPQTFAVGNENYTVTLDGYFDGQGNAISELVIPNLGNSDSTEQPFSREPSPPVTRCPQSLNPARLHYLVHGRGWLGTAPYAPKSVNKAARSRFLRVL